MHLRPYGALKSAGFEDLKFRTVYRARH